MQHVNNVILISNSVYLWINSEVQQASFQYSRNYFQNVANKAARPATKLTYNQYPFFLNQCHTLKTTHFINMHKKSSCQYQWKLYTKSQFFTVSTFLINTLRLLPKSVYSTCAFGCCFASSARACTSSLLKVQKDTNKQTGSNKTGENKLRIITSYLQVFKRGGSEC